MSDWSSLGEGIGKKSEADSQHARTSYTDYRTEQSAAFKAKHKEALGESVKLIVLGVAVLIAGAIVPVYSDEPFLSIVSLPIVCVGILLVVIGIAIRYFGER